MERLLTEKQKKLLFAKAKEYGLKDNDMIDIIKEFRYKSFKDILSDKLTDILNAMPLYADKRDKEILNEFKDIFG